MDFNEQTLKAALAGKKIGAPLYFFPTTESTNTRAFHLAEAGAPEGTVVVADAQSRGKGRMKREWLSPAGVNIYASLILRPRMDAVFSSPLTIMAGVAVAEVLSTFSDPPVQLKWPNDVLLQGCKVAGILTEMKTLGKEVQFVVLGIGINVNMRRDDLAPQLAKVATSMSLAAGKDFSRLEIAVKLFGKIEGLYKLFLREGMSPIRELWLGYARALGKCVEVTCGNEIYRGRVKGMDESGALLIVADSGVERRVIAGDTMIIKE